MREWSFTGTPARVSVAHVLAQGLSYTQEKQGMSRASSRTLGVAGHFICDCRDSIRPSCGFDPSARPAAASSVLRRGWGDSLGKRAHHTIRIAAGGSHTGGIRNLSTPRLIFPRSILRAGQPFPELAERRNSCGLLTCESATVPELQVRVGIALTLE